MRSTSPHAVAHHAVEVAFDPLIVNRDDIAQSTRCIVGHGGFLLLTWLGLATSSSASFGGRQPYSIVRNTPYVIRPSRTRNAPAGTSGASGDIPGRRLPPNIRRAGGGRAAASPKSPRFWGKGVCLPVLGKVRAHGSDC
jgi:hypothetical protein